jgi:hypothetical protein
VAIVDWPTRPDAVQLREREDDHQTEQHPQQEGQHGFDDVKNRSLEHGDRDEEVDGQGGVR